MNKKISLLVFLPIMLLLLNSCNSKSGLIDFGDPASVKMHKPILIAHRGGVVTQESPECSIEAVRLAKQQGYNMVELDIQQSKDNEPIVFHDRNMEKACGINKSIADLNAEEIVQLKYINSDQNISNLESALHVCSELELGIMLDVKAKADDRFFQKIVTSVKKYGLENSCVTINSDPVLRKNLQEISLLTVSQEEFKKVQQGITCDLQNKYWFGLPQNLPSEMVKLLQQNGAYVIPAINTFRYPEQGHYELAGKDIIRLSKAGVDGYQIDSVYKPLFEE